MLPIHSSVVGPLPGFEASCASRVNTSQKRFLLANTCQNAFDPSNNPPYHAETTHTHTHTQVLMNRLSSIFATGMVAAQHANFVLCMGFLEGLAGIGGDEKRPRIRQRLLSQPSVSEFKARWNLPIYFQLRQLFSSSLAEVCAGVGVGVGVGGGIGVRAIVTYFQLKEVSFVTARVLAFLV